MSEAFIYSFNIASIALMVLLTVMLGIATKLKGGAAYAAMIILLCNTSAYLYNMARSTGNYPLAEVTVHTAQLNALLMPLMYLFVKWNLTSGKSFRPVQFLHFLPCLALLTFSLLYFIPMDRAAFIHQMQMEASGENGTIVVAANDIVIALQVLVYFPLIFIYIRRREKSIAASYSDSKYLNVLWLKRLMIVFGAQFALILIFYTLFPQIDVWFIPLMNLLASCYLVYGCITYPTAALVNRLPPNKTEHKRYDSEKKESLSAESMALCCRTVYDYLNASRAYTDPSFSLPMLSVATGIPIKAISQSINTHLRMNFFDVINNMRVEEAKRVLSTKGYRYTIESIAQDCGFHSRSSFFLAFRKVEGTTPAKWLKSHPCL